jgi:hypothetical protein
LSEEGFGDGWLHAGKVGVFAADGSVQGRWLAPGICG